LALPAWFIKLFTEERDVVLDPFIGVGTTAVACVNLKRRCTYPNETDIKRPKMPLFMVKKEVFECGDSTLKRLTKELGFSSDFCKG
jgi:hypothetical protein